MLQVAEQSKPETTRAKIAHLAGNLKGALKRISETKSRMATRERPTLAALKKDNARIASTEHAPVAKSNGNTMLAKRDTVKNKPVKLARAS